MKTIEAIINEIKANEELQKKLAEAVKSNALADFLRELGCEATAEEFIAAFKPKASELSDDELDGVSGGANVYEGLMSVFTLGVGCLAAVYISLTTSGNVGGDGDEEGNLLCYN